MADSATPSDPAVTGLSDPDGRTGTPGVDSAPAPRQRRSLLPRTLSARLVAGALVLVLVVVSAAGTATYLALKSFLSQRLDQQLQNSADASSGGFNRGPGSAAADPTLRAPQTIWIAVFDGSGNLVEVDTSGEVKDLQLTDAQIDSLMDAREPKNITTVDGQHLRVVAKPVSLFQSSTTGTGRQFVGTGTAIVGLSTDDLTDTLNRLLLLEIGVGLGAAILAAGLTLWGVRRSLRPLHRVTATAREVTAELSSEGAGLDRRVPQPDSAHPDTEVGQLTQSFNSLLETVEIEFAERRASEDRMRQFLADASHELRTPLTSIRGYAELSRMRRRAEASAAGFDDTPADDSLDRIEAEGTRMSRLVDDLLLLARTDQGSVPQFSAVEVDDLLDEVVDSSRAAFPSRPIEIGSVPPATVFVDRDQLLRVIRNLVTNAAVHTDPEGAIHVSATVEVGATGGDDDWVTIVVRDEGPGLLPEDAEHVFERFWRADKSRARVRGGSGLGLSIVDTVVRAHGGTVQFESDVELGSTVSVRLPAVDVGEYEATKVGAGVM